jgi:hypothetical protein
MSTHSKAKPQQRKTRVYEAPTDKEDCRQHHCRVSTAQHSRKHVDTETAASKLAVIHMAFREAKSGNVIVF